ncbi:hypothetical protein ACSYAD_30450 [Acaryochloris marina NIES-2412]|uniref:hypothetical protein n=1 Tax=Acaryochloris marina TaxID=155978 RepID=UPI004059BF02
MKIAMASSRAEVIVPSTSNPTPINQPHPHRSNVFPDDCPKVFLGLGHLEIDELEGSAIPDFNLGNVDFHGIASGHHEKGPLVGDTRGLSKNDKK